MSASEPIFALAGCQHKSVDDELVAGDLAMQNTKLADAEGDYQRAASMAPDDPRPHTALGNLYVFEQKPSQAETEYQKVLELDAHNVAAHTALGNLFASQSQPGLAEEQYRAAVAIDSVNPTCLMLPSCTRFWNCSVVRPAPIFCWNGSRRPRAS